MANIAQISKMTERFYSEIGKLSLIPRGIERAESEGRREAAENLFNRAYELCFRSFMDIQNRIMPEIRKGKNDAAKFSNPYLEKKFGLLEFEIMAVANSYARTMNSMLREYLHLHEVEFQFAPPDLKKRRNREADSMDLDFEAQKKVSGYDGWLNEDLRYGEEK